MNPNSTTINVLGLGYVGLPSALLLASKGFKVLGTDISEDLVKRLSKQKMILDEEDLNKLYEKVVSGNKIEFSNKVGKSDFFIVCVPTPCNAEYQADLSYIFKSIDNIIKVLEEKNIIIIESTIPVGTCKLIKDYIQSNSNIKDPKICHCPERVLPGSSINEILNNDRVIGGTNSEVTEKVGDLYKTWTNSKLILMSSQEAELVKLLENSFRDVNIAFANTVSRVCESFNLSSKRVIDAANLHPRVSILDPGIGVGGHCIPIDPYFLISKLPQQTDLLLSARKLNKSQPIYIAQKLIKIIKGLNKYFDIELIGFAYKIDTSDIRESPAIEITKYLLENLKDRKIYLHDPLVKVNKILENEVIKTMSFKEDSLKIILVNHSIFNKIKGEWIIRVSELL